MRKLLKEPLVHFLALGAVLFGIGILRGDAAGPTSDRIEIPNEAPTSTQERAYTSPIWYNPGM